MVVRERYEHFRSRCSKTLKEMEKELEEQVDKKKHLEKGCVEPLYGEKAKCILHIVPQSKKCKSFNINKQCIKRNLTRRKKI